ncbi:hypothetical protein RJ641_019476 [Dillenia turbinata]|uniref:Uncharacterized protein n=1 Tax=Dillenia turbinata TaxID=194707 RepID=A0AAN8UJK4_9MAGN
MRSVYPVEGASSHGVGTDLKTLRFKASNLFSKLVTSLKLRSTTSIQIKCLKIQIDLAQVKSDRSGHTTRPHHHRNRRIPMLSSTESS